MAKKKTLPKPESTYKTTVTYQCPVRGTVTQEVEVKRYSSACIEPNFDEELSAFLAQEGITVSADDDDITLQTVF